MHSQAIFKKLLSARKEVDLKPYDEITTGMARALADNRTITRLDVSNKNFSSEAFQVLLSSMNLVNLTISSHSSVTFTR